MYGGLCLQDVTFFNAGIFKRMTVMIRNKFFHLKYCKYSSQISASKQEEVMSIFDSKSFAGMFHPFKLWLLLSFV